MNSYWSDRLEDMNDLRSISRSLKDDSPHPVAVMGNAPSILELDKKKLDDMLTIGVNRISRYYTPHFLIWTESDWFIPKEFSQLPEIRASKSPIKICPSNIARPTEAIPFERSGLGSEYRDGLINSDAIITALHWAILIGGNPIYLCGVDLSSSKHHFYDKVSIKDTVEEVGYPDNDETPVLMRRPDGQPASFPRNMVPELLERGFKEVEYGDNDLIAKRQGALRNDVEQNWYLSEHQTPLFDNIKNLCKSNGIKIYNCSRRSRLEIFEKSNKLNRSGLTHKRGKNARNRTRKNRAAA